MPNNFAFIDGQNLHLGFKERLGWSLDFRAFRVHLKERYGVARAYYFIGFVPENQGLYTGLQIAGYTLIFKTVMPGGGKPKGNVDAELVLRAMIEYPNYDRAVIVTSDPRFRVPGPPPLREGKTRAGAEPDEGKMLDAFTAGRPRTDRLPRGGTKQAGIQNR